MPATLNADEFEVPDSRFEVLDRAADTLCEHNTRDLSDLDSTRVDLMLSALFNMMHARAEQLADAQPIPGKIDDSVLEANIPGYRQAVELATYLVGVLR